MSSPSYCGINNSFSPPNMPLLHNTQPRWVFPELSKLPIEELEFLNNNIDAQQEFINDFPPIKEQNKLLDALILQVEELAGCKP